MPDWLDRAKMNLLQPTLYNGGCMKRLADNEIADGLLIEWHRWTAMYRPNLGTPRTAPYCQQSVTSKQYDDPADLVHDKVYQTEMKTVAYCVDAIAVPMQQAIGTEMRNRDAKVKVWRDRGGATYAEALVAILPVMRKRGLFD